MTPLSTDPNRPSYRLDIRVTKAGDGFVAHAAELPCAFASGKTERDAVGEVFRKVSAFIRDCRKTNSPVLWHTPPPLAANEVSRVASLNMPTRQEELYRDRRLLDLLYSWAKTEAKRKRECKKQRRRVAARLHELDWKSEASSVLRQGWAAWEDAAMISVYMGNEGMATSTSSRLRAAFAELEKTDHPVALMRLWWLRLAERTNAEHQYEHPSPVDAIDLEKMGMKDAHDMRGLEKFRRREATKNMTVYQGKQENVEIAVQALLEADKEAAEKDAEAMKDKVKEAYKQERDGALVREMAEQLELKQVVEQNEENRREQS